MTKIKVVLAQVPRQFVMSTHLDLEEKQKLGQFFQPFRPVLTPHGRDPGTEPLLRLLDTMW